MSITENSSTEQNWFRGYYHSHIQQNICYYKNKFERHLLYACSVMSNSLWPHWLWPTRLLSPRDSPGKNTGARCHFLLQGILTTRGSNPCLLRLLGSLEGIILSEKSQTKANTVWYHLHMKSRKYNKLMNIKKREASHRCREQTDSMVTVVGGNIEEVGWEGVG